MQTDFAYIDDAVSSACERELKSPTVPRDGLKVKATKVIAGFHIYDAKEEDRLLAERVEHRRGAVERFQADRDVAAAECTKRGIVPLAIVPVDAWARICTATTLYRLSPGEGGRVGFAADAFSGIKVERRMTGEQQVEWLAKNNWPAFVLRLFPKLVSVEQHDAQNLWGGVGGANFGGGGGGGGSGLALVVLQQQAMMMQQLAAQSFPNSYQATLVMPTPPADIAEILLKANDIPELKVAAVADAIAFKETPTQLFRNVRSAEEAVARMLREDPIVYFERGTAAAIIAQFGDFPVERQVVDRIITAENLLRFFPNEVR
jgi:hypothetical protein